jgi:hypothetical protein
MDDFQKQVAALNAFLSEQAGRTVVESEINTEHQGKNEVSFKVTFADDSSEEIEVPYEALREHMTQAQAARHQERPPQQVPEQYSRSLTVLSGEEYESNARKIMEQLRPLHLEENDAVESAQSALDDLGLNVKVVYGPPLDVDGVWVGQFGVMNADMTQTGAGVSFQWGVIASSYERAVELLSAVVRDTKV